ncbi:hypothetical protein D5085_06815 [Ectothiorhodospiraceae bacterium BW-2]|nr:hypothetical protein D5085_06815 [Ectothiorhodospiraceae bacterium BW-2]
MRLSPALLLTTLLLPLTAAHTATDWRNNRLAPPEKVTVGPSDNYQATLDSQNGQLFFTRNENQISQIYRQQLNSGQAERLLEADHDAKDPALSPDGRWLALTSFRRDAQGDICLYPLHEGGQFHCLTEVNSRDETPFWLNHNHIGYLSRTMMTTGVELIVQAIDGSQKEVVRRGSIAAPTASSDGRYLVYHVGGEASGLYLLDRQTGTETGPLSLDLPGLSSYARFSADNRYLYFGHYLNDTSADQYIDGNDNSVVFRLPLAQLVAANDAKLLPEQLISVGQSCNFPAPTETRLYVTCAYEGSLDIYTLPLSGQVPASWSREQLWESHQNARSHEDRLLLLNTLRYRLTDERTATMLERLLSHHLEIGEFSAADYYVAQLHHHYQISQQPRLAEFYTNLQRLLQARAAKEQQPPAVITPRFRRQIATWQQQLQGPRLTQEIFSAWFAHLLGDNRIAAENLANIAGAEAKLLPLEFYLATELNRAILADKPQQLLPILLNASFNRHIELESRLFYAFHYLRLLSRTEPDPLLREQQLQASLSQLQEPVLLDLFLNEIDLLAMVQAEELSTQRLLFAELSKRLKKYKAEQSIRRIAHIRAIQILGEAEQFQLMELMSRHWLTIAHVSEMAFVDIAEQYSIITVNKGYGLLSEGDALQAANTFYSAIRQTNDLEAHYQYIVLGLSGEPLLQQRLQQAYEILNREALLGVNQRYVEALQRLLNDPQQRPETLQQALTLLEGLRPVGLNPSLRDLLLGYLYQRQLQQKMAGYRYDKELYQKAHYHYMLALDQAYDNVRIEAAILTNLGQLHFSVGNYGLASDFYSRRAALPFSDSTSEAWLLWQQSRALFYYNALPQATATADRAWQLAQQANLPELTAFAERAAFYALQAGHYPQAAERYQQLLAQHELEATNRTKALLGLGYAHYHLNQPDRAIASLEQLLTAAQQLQPLAASTTRLVRFEPQRLQLLALGLLANLSPDPKQQIDYQQQRLALLQQLDGRSSDFAWNEQGRLEFMLKSQQQLALAYESAKMLPQMATTMAHSLPLLTQWLEAGGGYNSPAVIRTLTNYLSLSLLYPEQFQSQPTAPLAALLPQTVTALTLQPYTPPMTAMQRLQLQLLDSGYRYLVRNTLDKKGLTAEIEALQQHPDWQQLPSQRPELAAELMSRLGWLLNR